jgi:fructosamine-3-kinase
VNDRTAERIREATGREPRRLTPLAGGCIAEVRRVDFDRGAPLVAKIGRPGDRLDIEGRMHATLADAGLPVPAVISAEDDLLLTAWIENDGRRSPDGDRQAAIALAHLHAQPQPAFGHDEDTLIGPLALPNQRDDDWPRFFRDRRLMHFARLCLDAGRIDTGLMARIERLADNITRHLPADVTPSLLHGDVWTGNLLWQDGRLAAFIDPAVTAGDRELEFTFATVWATFDADFFAAYEEILPFSPGFHEERRHLYNLYPLLVHTRLFGGGYGQMVSQTLSRFGY